LHYKQIDLNFLHISCSSQSESQKPIGCRNPNVLDLIWLMNSTALDCSKCSGSGQKDKSKLTHTDTHTHTKSWLLVLHGKSNQLCPTGASMSQCGS